MTELTELIRNKSPPTSDEVADSTKFVSFFADLIFTVQDFMLQLELDGNPITEEEYLDNALKLNSGINFQEQGGRKLSRKWDKEPYMISPQQALSSVGKN